VTTLILLRHGRSSANVAGVLAGRTPGVELDETGRAQAQKVVERLAGVPIADAQEFPCALYTRETISSTARSIRLACASSISRCCACCSSRARRTARRRGS